MPSKKETQAESAGDPDAASIGILKKQLYAQEESAELKMRAKQLGTPKKITSLKLSGGPAQPDLVDIIKKRAKRRRKIFKWSIITGLILVAFGGAAAMTYIYRQAQQVKEDQIGIALNAPADVTAGEEITYAIDYQNNSRVEWKNVELFFTPPAGFRYSASEPPATQAGQQRLIAIGTLAAGQKGTATISGRLIGELNASVLARAELVISPVNFEKARLSRSQTVNTTIAAVPLEIAIEASNNAAGGERLLAVLRVRNTSTIALDGAVLRLLPADGLQFATEDEQFSANYSVLDSWWELPPIEPLEEVTRNAVLHVSGQPGEKRTLGVQGAIKQDGEVYVLREVSHVITVSASELAVTQLYDGSDQPQVVKAGQKLAGVVKYKNVGTVGLKNVIIALTFEGEGFDPASLDLKQGAYNPITRTITWTAASVPQLAAVLPQREGELEYAFSILPIDQFPAVATAKNQSLITSATIDSPDLPTPTGQDRRVISDRLELPIGTEVSLQVDSFYDDGRLGIDSSGPVPPEVGEQTTYTLRFRLGSTLNDIGDVRLVAVLPDGVTYLNRIYKTAGDVEFNERTGEISWSIVTVEGLTGRSKPPQELHVQVGITPGENLRGEIIQLLQSAKVEALDLYTDESVTYTLSSFPSTETASPKQGKVE